MPKHRWRESFKSFFGSPEKDDQLRGAKTEIDGKVQKILKFLKNEDADDRKEALADLMEDFNNYYQALYARYDNLTEELRKKVPGKRGADSSSSSSDSSDSDDSPREKGKKVEVEDNFEKDTAVIKQELEMALLEIGDLKRKLAATVDEKEALFQEYQSAMSKTKEAQRTIVDLNTEGDKWNEVKSKLLIENAELIQKLEVVNRDREGLIAGNEAAFISIKEEKRIVEELRSINNQLRVEKGMLEHKISEYERILAERGDEVITTQKKMEDEQTKASSQIAALTEQIHSLQQQLELTQSEKSQLDLHIERGMQEFTESLAKAENQHTELVNKIIDQKRKLKEQDDAFTQLSEEHKQLKVQFQNCAQNLISSEHKIQEMTVQFQNDIDAKGQEVDQLEESMEDLKRELEMKVDEMSTLVENMRTTEVKQRLTSQKLRITEQVLGENEEIHQQRVEKLQEEQKLLEGRIATLSGIIATYREAQVRIVAEISDKVNDTLMGIDTFSMKFEEDYGHLESRIYEILNELKVATNWICANNAEKDQLKKGISSLLLQLKSQKEQELLLTAKIEELETILQNDKDERIKLVQNIKQQEEKVGELEKTIEDKDGKMGELERKMNEKDDGLLSLSEEKREAIRQLCIWIDYHHSRYHDLKDMILKARGGRRQIAA